MTDSEAPTPNVRHWTDELLTKNTDRGGVTLVGAPKLPNAITILAHHPAWKDVLAWDEFALRLVFAKVPPFHPDDAPPVSVKPGERVTDEDLTRIAAWFARSDIQIDTLTNSTCNLSIGKATVAEAVAVVARRNAYHPVRRYLESLTWDGRSRVRTWIPYYLGVVDNDYSRSVGAWWLVSGAARIFVPGCQADHVLTLEGPQGVRKSTALRALGDPWFTDEIADLSSKDSLMQMHGVWIVEFAEFDTLSRAEAAKSKAFITARVDRFRLPYSKTVEEFPRSCVCAASVNGSDYLKDETGNRRFWPVACAVEHPIAIEEIRRDRDQLWAEAVHMFRAGHAWWPEDEGMTASLEREQRDRLVSDDWEGAIAVWLRCTFNRPLCRPPMQQIELGERRRDDWKPCRLCQNCLAEYGVSTLDVLRGALELDLQRIDRGAQMRAGACLLRLGFSKERRTDGDRRVWMYLAPPPASLATGPPPVPLPMAAE